MAWDNLEVPKIGLGSEGVPTDPYVYEIENVDDLT